MGKAETGTGRGRLGILLCAIVCMLLLAGAACAASGSYSLKLRQVYVDYPQVTAFAELLDASGAAAKLAGTDKLTLNIDGKTVETSSIQPFSRGNDGIATIFVIDVSSSIQPRRFEELKATISQWIKHMGAKDRAAVVTFGDSVKVAQDYTGEQQALLGSVRKLNAKAKTTQLNSGLIRALELAGINNSELPARRMVLLCSDGLNDSTTGATADEVREAIAAANVPVYAIFFDTGRMTAANRTKAIESLGEFSRRSGGQMYNAKTSPFAGTFDAVNKALGKAVVLRGDVSTISADGTSKRMDVIFTNGTVTVSDGLDIRLVSAAAKTASPDAVEHPLPPKSKFELFMDKLNTYPLWVKALAGALLLLLIGLLAWLFVRRRRRRMQLETQEEDAFAASGDSAPSTTLAGGAPFTPGGAAPFTTGSPAPFTTGSPAPYAGAGQTFNMPQAPVTNRSPDKPKLPAMQIELHVSGTSGPTNIYKASVSNRLTLGRSASGPSSLAITGDGTISAQHCELSFTNGVLHVVDLRSTNGTMVNGVPIKGTYPLNDGDLLMLGKTELRLQDQGHQMNFSAGGRKYSRFASLTRLPYLPEALFWVSGLAWLYFLPFGGSHSLCVYHFLTGRDCPGCGLGRAIHYVLHGNFALGCQYHIFAVPVLLVLSGRIVNLFHAFYKFKTEGRQ